MSIRNRLILMLTVPLVALVLVAAFGFAQLSADSELLEDAEVTTQDAILADTLGRAIGTERLGFEAGFSGAQLSVLTDATDAAIENATTGTTELTALAELAQATVDTARSTTGTLQIQEYGIALDQIDDFINTRSLNGFSTDGVSVILGLQQARVAAETQEEAWTSVWGIQEASPSAIAEVSRLFANADDERGDAAAVATDSGQRPYQAPTASSNAGQLLALKTIVLADLSEGVTPDIGSAEVFDLLWESRGEWNDAAQQGSQFLANDVNFRTSDTNNQRSLFTLLAALAAFLLAVLVFVISRSIVGPLTRLIDEAESVTERRLPRAVAELRRVGADDVEPQIRPIKKETDDEIGSLVDAFNSVQGTAMRVATDQARSRRNVAEMFVNLGRRNQQLNHRMLNLISELERDEQDPEVLKGLYRLDHMATRMRRNAESLLVLAGNRSPRQWSRPVAAEDIMRSALAEVENFERIEIGQIPQALIRGSVVTDVTHLLAELLDNATNFSDPTTTVTISGHETVDGVEIEISDTGLGINEADLGDLNTRITDPPALDEAPSRLLGLFVVGRLAQEHGIHVTLDSEQGVGTVATVRLPESMIPQETADSPTPLQTLDMDPGVGETVRAELGFDAEPAVDVVETASPNGDTWTPDATHEVALADAAVPTMDEVEEAMPSFPSVTIDEPSAPETPAMAPVAENLPPADANVGAWPLNSVDNGEENLPVRELHDREHVDAGAQLEPMPAPIQPPAAEAPAPLPAPPIQAPVAEAPAPLPAPPIQAPVAEVPEPMPAPIQPPAAEAHAATPSLPTESADSASGSVFDLAPPPPIDGSPEHAAAPAHAANPAPASTMEAMPAPVQPVDISAPMTEAMPAPITEAMPAPVQPVDISAPMTEAMPAPTQPVEAAPAAHIAEPASVDTPGPAHAAAAEPAMGSISPAVKSADTFGGLPVRSPQAALADAEADAVMPLPEVEPAAPVSAAKTTGAFAAFASGVNRRLTQADDPNSSDPQSEGSA